MAVPTPNDLTREMQLSDIELSLDLFFQEAQLDNTYFDRTEDLVRSTYLIITKTRGVMFPMAFALDTGRRAYNGLAGGVPEPQILEDLVFRAEDPGRDALRRPLIDTMYQAYDQKLSASQRIALQTMRAQGAASNIQPLVTVVMGHLYRHCPTESLAYLSVLLREPGLHEFNTLLREALYR